MFDGESVWEEFVNSLDEQSRPDHFRLNISLPQSAVIDDVTGMEQLRETARFHPTASVARLRIARALLVSCFYFELDQAPVHDCETGRYRVQGSIRCRSNSYDVVEALENVEILWVEYAIDAGVLSNRGLAREDICPVCHRAPPTSEAAPALRSIFIPRDLLRPLAMLQHRDLLGSRMD